MVKSPAFQFYYKEWLTGTKGMSRIEKDIYLTLIIYQFDFKNKLPKDEVELIRICEAKGKKEIESLKYVVTKKFKVDGDFLVNRKMSEVVVEQDLYRQKQANNGSLGGRPKKAVGYSGFTENNPNESPIPITVSIPVNTNTHEVFADRILKPENELDKEAIEVSTKRMVTPEILKQFNANLKNKSKHHSHYSQYKEHLVNWMSKLKIQEPTKKQKFLD